MERELLNGSRTININMIKIKYKHIYIYLGRNYLKRASLKSNQICLKTLMIR